MKYPYYSPARIQAALRERGAAVRKSLGQNFLVEAGVSGRIAGLVLEVCEGPLLEIGPGLGSLSHQLLLAGRDVTAVEVDPVLAALLREYVADLKSDAGASPAAAAKFTLIEGDARLVLAELAGTVAARSICGNLPYYISTELLRACMWAACERGVFLLQSQFAERVAARSAASSLSVYMQNYGDWELGPRVSAGAFFPRPGVDSRLLIFRARPDGPACDPDLLERVLRLSFFAKRKKLANNWKRAGDGEGLNAERLFEAAGDLFSNPNIRPEEVPIATYFDLTRRLNPPDGTL